MGQFPEASASPYGPFDLVGNVFEWTSSLSRPYPYDPRDGREDLRNTKEGCVLRGGHYGGYSGYVHAAYRFSASPDDGDGNYGFRLALGLNDTGA